MRGEAVGFRWRRPRWAGAAVLVGLVVAGCSSTTTSGATPSPSPSPGRASAAPSPVAVATPGTPTPIPLPPYAIDALRARPHQAGGIAVGAVLASTSTYVKHAMTWTSMGATMTGVIDLPRGTGPFPVVVVNHGYVPVGQYYVGQDSSKYADPLAAAGFLTLSPNYPGYAGSGPGEHDVPPIVAEAISDMDLISALPSLSTADTSRVAVAGHSNGGGVSLLLLAAEPRVRAVVLYAPVSSDMADNARKWWVHSSGGTGPVGTPDSDPAAYALMSPRGHLPADGPPTLIMQGTDDEDIPAAWTAATVQALEASGTRTRFVSFPGAMHNFQGADLTRANGLAVDWLRGALGG